MGANGNYPPRPRQPGQRGGMGGHGRNMHTAQKRDMGRSKGGGGGNKNNGCAVVAIALVASPLLAIWGVAEAVKAVW